MPTPVSSNGVPAGIVYAAVEPAVVTDPLVVVVGVFASPGVASTAGIVLDSVIVVNGEASCCGTLAVISRSICSTLALWKTMSSCGCRSSAPQMPAYDMIVEPLAGSYAVSPSRLLAQFPARSLLNVCSAPNW